jgi:2-polyprenyl-6-methoxyphenol hydroxylase-like FAD-dependent oxidoreductase
MLPIGMKWGACPGVNLAMVDALKLAKALIGYAGEKEKLIAAMREFETEMFERAEQYARNFAQLRIILKPSIE